MAFDPDIGKVVLFGGAPFSGSPYTDTWEWDGVNWTRISPPTQPPGRTGASLTWNPARNRLVLFGGEGGFGIIAPLNDTWEFDGSTWSRRIDAGTGPGPAYWMGADYDPVLGAEVVYGGDTGSRVSIDPFETWTFNAPRLLPGLWTLAFRGNRPHPPATHEMAMAYVPSLVGTVAFGGFNDRPYNETWQLGPAGWSQLHPPTSPPPMFGMAAATDPRGGLLVRSYPDAGSPSPGTWELAACRLVPGAPPPPTAPSIPGAGGGGPPTNGPTYG